MTDPSDPTDPVPPAAAAGDAADRPSAIVLRAMAPRDVPFVVGLHEEFFGQGFFVRLGPRFLARYYRTFLGGPTAVALIGEVGGVAAGYLVGVLDPPRHRQQLLRRHGRSLALSATGALLRRPRLLVWFVRTRLRRYVRSLVRARSRSGAASTGAGSVGAAPAVLSYVAVDPAMRGHGLGSALVTRFLADVAASGRREARLVTVAGDAGAGAFYTAAGWVRAGESRREDGQPLEHYRHVVEQTS